MPRNRASGGKRLTEQRRQAALKALEDSRRESDQRIADAVAGTLGALEDKANHLTAAEQADQAAGTAVRVLIAEGLSVEQILNLLDGAVTARDVRRYGATTVVAQQEVVESGRVPYSRRRGGGTGPVAAVPTGSTGDIPTG